MKLFTKKNQTKSAKDDLLDRRKLNKAAKESINDQKEITKKATKLRAQTANR